MVFPTQARRARLAAVLALSLAGFLATFPRASAGAAQNDGTLPIYPRAPIVSGGRAIPSAAYARGFMGIGQTSDKPALVIAWYRAHLPPVYTTSAQSGGTQFKGPGGTVNVVTFKGYTRIALIPTQPQLPTCITNLYPPQIANCAAPSTVPRKHR